MLRRTQTGIRIDELETLGMPSEAKEAVAFAVLANETISGNKGNIPGVTGAGHSVVLGVIAPGPGARFSVD
jgi:anhydro-N-acetylmuramic acid kinase